jgi:hypothetical protein
VSLLPLPLLNVTWGKERPMGAPGWLPRPPVPAIATALPIGANRRVESASGSHIPVRRSPATYQSFTWEVREGCQSGLIQT